MDFATLVVFLILYYVRPQEWIGAVAAIQPVKWSVLLALIAMVTRQRGFRVRDFLQTPHDWLMLLYFAWIVLSNANPIGTLLGNYNLFVFYLVTVQALVSAQRIQTFLGWWTFMIMVVGGLAVAAEYGFDLVDSYDLTHGKMKHRLVFNTSIFDNPNALGHSIYPAVFMSYFFLFWKRPIFMKIATLALVLLPLYCVYLTVSKGAFIGVFVTLVAALTFGRPRMVQIGVLAAAMTLGWAVLWSMPRMGELENSSADAAIQGRVAAFKFGIHTLKHKINGVGIYEFANGVEGMFGFKKAAHSSYVQVGGELGWPGLFFFVSILYCCLRTLVNAKTTDLTEERVRRILFVLLVSYCLSSWMVNWPWRATFFLMVATIASFHRLMLGKDASPDTESETETELAPVTALPQLQPAPALSAAGTAMFNQAALTLPQNNPAAHLTQEFSEATPAGLRWNKIGWVDLILMGVLTWITILLWQYLITRM